MAGLQVVTMDVFLLFGSIPFSQLHKLLFPGFQFLLEYTTPSTFSCSIFLTLFVDNHCSHTKGFVLLSSWRLCIYRS